MTEALAPPGMGLTPRMKAALEAITQFAAAHGAMPSRKMLAQMLGCNRNNANRLIASLVERGEVHSATPGGPLAGFGESGVAVLLPPHLAAQLAAFCSANGERVPAVVSDAIVLHLDQCERVPRE